MMKSRVAQTSTCGSQLHVFGVRVRSRRAMLHVYKHKKQAKRAAQAAAARTLGRAGARKAARTTSCRRSTEVYE
jgi:hypothetical protein